MEADFEMLAEALAEELRARGYMESSIGLYMKHVQQIAASAGGMAYTKEVGERYASQKLKASGEPYDGETVSFRVRVVRALNSYIETGSFELTRNGKRPHALPESEGLLCGLNDYALDNRERGLADSACTLYLSLAREFALYAESVGMPDYDCITRADAIGFLAHMSAMWPGSEPRRIVSCTRPFLLYLGREDLAEALSMARPGRRHAIVEALSAEEARAIAETCCSGRLRSRDAAITLLALTTGMRCCDIVELRIGDVDWRSMSISIVQHKTGNPLTVPLAPALAEALGRYLLEDRPECGTDIVFVGVKAPYSQLTSGTVWGATKRAFDAAGVVGRAGARRLRHAAATGMLRAGAALPVISAMLGHADPESTKVYLETDEERMRACVLPLPKGAAR